MKQHFRETDPFLGSLVTPSPSLKASSLLSRSCADNAGLQDGRASHRPLALPLLLTFTPIGFMSCLPCGKAFKLIQPSSRVYPGSTHWDFPSFLLHREEGGGKPDRGRQHLGEPGEQPCSFPELGFYCRRCIPWEGGCACVGAFPHSGQLLFNEGLHAGQTPEEIFAVLGSHPGSAAAHTPDAGMDGVVEITPAEEAALGSSQASRMHLGKDLRRIRCAVLLCLLSVLVLALPIAYLLVGNLRAPSSCAGQVRVGQTISILPPCEEESATSRVSRVGVVGSFILFMSFSRLREFKKLPVTFLLPHPEQICLA